MAIISTKLRNSAKGKTCTFQIPGVCNHDPETTVLCHAPSEQKGMGNKSPDYFAAFGCYACHEALDQHRLSDIDEFYYWLRGIARTWLSWVESGLIVLPVDPATAKTRPKKKHKWPSRPIQNRSSFARAEPLGARDVE